MLKRTMNSSAQAGLELHQRPGAVAQLIFYIFAQLRERLLETNRHKQRVVAKTVLPARCRNNPAFANAVESSWLEFIRVTNRRGALDFSFPHPDQILKASCRARK